MKNLAKFLHDNGISTDVHQEAEDIYRVRIRHEATGRNMLCRLRLPIEPQPHTAVEVFTTLRQEAARVESRKAGSPGETNRNTRLYDLLGDDLYGQFLHETAVEA